MFSKVVRLIKPPAPEISLTRKVLFDPMGDRYVFRNIKKLTNKLLCVNLTEVLGVIT